MWFFFEFKGEVMFNFDEVSYKSKEVMEMMLKNYLVVIQGFQVIVIEVVDFFKKFFEESVVYVEKFVGVKSIEVVVELQIVFVKVFFDKMVVEVMKISEFYVDVVKIVYVLFQMVMNKVNVLVVLQFNEVV